MSTDSSAVPLLVQYLTAAVSVHAILLSLAALLAVNSLRQLTEVERDKWTKASEEQKSWDRRLLGAVFDVIPSVSGIVTYAEDPGISRLTIANLRVGAVGIIYSLIGISLSQSVEALPSLCWSLVVISLFLIGCQLVKFFRLADVCMNTLTSWFKEEH
jgi:xanthosine utilization system XapX-like protein